MKYLFNFYYNKLFLTESYKLAWNLTKHKTFPGFQEYYVILQFKAKIFLYNFNMYQGTKNKYEMKIKTF